MSKIIIYDLEEKRGTIILDRKEECKYKVNGKCYNNGDIKHLGKVCRNTCIFYEIEEMEKGDKVKIEIEKREKCTRKR